MCKDHECIRLQELEELRKENAQLKAELEKLKTPPKDSSNSSKPPSTDQKSNKYPSKEKSWKKPGGQKGHKGKTKFMADNPDEIKEIIPNKCPHCNNHHILNTGKILEKRQEIDIPPIVPYIVEYQQMAGQCTMCGSRVVEKFPENITASVIYGNNITAMISYLNVSGRMGYQQITTCFRDLFNCPISEGTVQNKLKKTAKNLKPLYDNILELLKTSPVIGSDETGLRITAQNAYSWVFQNNNLTYLTAQFSRGFKVIDNLFGQSFNGIWVSDRYPAQLKIKGNHQLCLAHLIRDCIYLGDSKKSKFAKSLLNLLNKCIKFRKENNDDYDPLKYTGEITKFKEKMSNIFSKAPPTKEEKTLYSGLLGRQNEMLLFLENSSVPFDNNGSERALRGIVTKRKVSNGFRSTEGAEIYCIIASVFQTLQKQKLNIFYSLINLLNGKNILLQT